ncbi:hypothetical protein CANTEDRAFT_112528 [Yamadazyma tenuis ATCC 10573]|uniref:Uncharacterized protein n=1 Tax=Candida tenuis (strain ATCC 10573 / BCRC 21748 / CBS 615 / JCM 9827 / NBRC 10315 / NRRL Y-1498 / VKM Y-70) TaxID=590646 RepID=G3AXN3_CANTC|nr:uncharacterized protein CANTEDRAFT_112528 [Yamadazyma tenuis ATCC 10573]EGV65658.1 hypothetical protein CANTEDRAFT_112528 [Yamadazyma tenuis ATCC 10573]
MTVVYPQSYEDSIRYHILHTVYTQSTQPQAGRKLKELALSAGFSSDQISVTMGNWCWSSSEDRHTFGEIFSSRAQNSTNPVILGDSDTDAAKRKQIVEGWHSWSEYDAGFLVLFHGEIVCKKESK